MDPCSCPFTIVQEGKYRSIEYFINTSEIRIQ